MNIEVVEFYPTTIIQAKKFYKGTLHLYLIDLDIDVRGCCCQYFNGNVNIYLPSRISFDPEENKKIHYPTFSFTCREKNKKFIEIAKQKAKEYIVKKYNLRS